MPVGFKFQEVHSQKISQTHTVRELSWASARGSDCISPETSTLKDHFTGDLQMHEDKKAQQLVHLSQASVDYDYHVQVECEVRHMLQLCRQAGEIEFRVCAVSSCI